MVEDFHALFDDMAGGDLSDNKGVQKLRDYQAMIKTSLTTISKEFSLELAKCTDIGSFQLFKSFKSPVITYSLKSASDDPPLEVFLVQHHREECFVGLLTLNKEYPVTYIFRETLKEKINDWFVRLDVDFEDQKKFSNQFYVVCQDREKLKPLLWNKALDDLADFPEMEIEINGKFCLFRNSIKPLSIEEANNFVVFTKKLRRVFS